MRGKTLANFVKLTIFAVVTAIVTAILGFTISNSTPGGFPKSYRAEFTDATGLLPGDDVRIAGVRVGQVRDIKVVDRKYAMVTFGVQNDVPVRVSTEAKLRYRNLVGQRFMELVEGPGADTPLRQNGLIPLSRTEPALDLTALFDGFRPLFKALTPEDVNRFSMELVKTLQGEGGTMESLVANTASLTTTLAQRDQAIGRVIDNLNTVLATVDDRNNGLSDLISQLQRLVTGLAGDRQTIAASLQNINGLTASTASLLQGIRPPLPADLANLSAVSRTLATTNLPNGQNMMDEFLGRFPSKLNTIIRTATYGSWFNFWLCDADIMTTDQTTGKRTVTPVRTHVNDQACGVAK